MPPKVFNIAHFAETAGTVGLTTKGPQITGDTSIQNADRSQPADSVDNQCSTRPRESQVCKATMGRNDGRRAVAPFRCEEKFCGSSDNGVPTGHIPMNVYKH